MVFLTSLFSTVHPSILDINMTFLFRGFNKLDKTEKLCRIMNGVYRMFVHLSREAVLNVPEAIDEKIIDAFMDEVSFGKLSLNDDSVHKGFRCFHWTCMKTFREEIVHHSEIFLPQLRRPVYWNSSCQKTFWNFKGLRWLWLGRPLLLESRCGSISSIFRCAAVISRSKRVLSLWYGCGSSFLCFQNVKLLRKLNEMEADAKFTLKASDSCIFWPLLSCQYFSDIRSLLTTVVVHIKSIKTGELYMSRGFDSRKTFTWTISNHASPSSTVLTPFNV